MLIKKMHDIKCPSCGTVFNKELWNIIDIRMFPEVKKTIFEGSLNKVTCNKCKFDFYVEVPFIYQDVENELFVTVLPESMKENEDNIRMGIKKADEKANMSSSLKKYIFFGINTFTEFLKRVEN